MQIALHHYEYIRDGHSLYWIVRNVVRTLNAFITSPYNALFDARTDDWNIHLIRHKKKKTYMIDTRHAVTIASVTEHKFNCKRGQRAWFNMNSRNGHAEVEVYMILVFTHTV